MMSQESSAIDVNQADIFSRGSLALTFDLIRPKDALLALNVRNIIFRNPVFAHLTPVDKQYWDHYRVTLNYQQVSGVLKCLLALTDKDIEAQDNPAMVVILKPLIEEWMLLSHKILSEKIKTEVYGF